MKKSRASKGLLLPPMESANYSAAKRQDWLESSSAGFVSKGKANPKYYRAILDLLWHEGHGIPGPHISEQDLWAMIDDLRKSEGKVPYKDPFRRMRELQGEEGFTSIIKEGVRYQLQSLEIGPKREPRARIPSKLWKEIKEKSDYTCAHCGQKEPNVKLSPDHKRPRSRGGDNEIENIQPFCEQCNNKKSSACQGCDLNCNVCSWAYPETYKPIQINDQNKERIRREAEKQSKGQSEVANGIIRNYFKD